MYWRMAAWIFVVGNSTYAHIVRHRVAAEPGEHRRRHIVGATAARLGGDNRGREDTDRVNLTEALRAFMFRSMGAEVSLLSYAGHGFEMDGVNYLLPVCARLARDVDMIFPCRVLVSVD